ncbi:non-homologous end joining protein Ku [Kitasatospora sp. NE20-6]|uniref:non-homologous end joining protein Ku n=1 Tax=Kitasatospora sp. NE20-6 TaxID=2859066 RepID=UPI0034DC56A7
MARPMWTGALTFGLVTVPVGLYTATESHAVHFHQLERGTFDRVRNRRVNERTGEEVAFSDIVKGYDTGDGEYVVIEPEELEQISPGRSRTIDVSGFVELSRIDPIFFDKTYYLGPQGKEYAKIYQLLAKALERSDRAGLAMFSMRGKEYLTAVRAQNGLLELHTMHFADEVRDPREEIDDLPGGKEPISGQELQTAEQLIGMLAVDWDPGDYHDTFEEQVHKLIDDKQAGREIATSAGPAPEGTNIVDLMDALRRSLDSVQGMAELPPADKPDEAGKVDKANRANRANRAGTSAASGTAGRAAGERSRRTPKAVAGKKSTSASRTSTSRTSTSRTSTSETGTSGTAAPLKKRATTGHAAKEDLSALTKAELYRRATDLDIAHRSTMSRDELQAAVRKAAGHRRLRTAS